MNTDNQKKFVNLMAETLPKVANLEVKSRYIGWGIVLTCGSVFLFGLSDVLAEIPAIIESLKN